MEKVAVLLRFLQFYAHAAHNLCKGTQFLSDHEFLGGLYPTYEAAYDSVVERMIGLGQKPNLASIHKEASSLFAKSDLTGPSFETAIGVLLKTEKTLISTIEKEVLPNPMTHPHGGKDALSQGSVQLLGDIANASEMRQYKMKQRLGE